jgi:pimeloyl-ACP methyl ester carboxylesterase
MIAAAGTSAGAGRSERLGVILLHGKLGDPLERRAGLDALAANLLAAGHAIALPSMPWSDRGWLTIDRDVPAALLLIDRLAAARLVLVGHSLGADVALAYAVSRRAVAGLVMAAPSHTPAALAAHDAAMRDSLARARALVAGGYGDTPSIGPDGAQGASHTLLTRAAVYLSWMDPQGLAEMSVQAPHLPASIPLMLVTMVPWIGSPSAPCGRRRAIPTAAACRSAPSRRRRRASPRTREESCRSNRRSRRGGGCVCASGGARGAGGSACAGGAAGRAATAG